MGGDCCMVGVRLKFLKTIVINNLLSTRPMWETIAQDMKHPIWAMAPVSNTQLLNQSTFNTRNESGRYVIYRFKKPVAIRGLMSLFYSPSAIVAGDSSNPAVASLWYVEGRIGNTNNTTIPHRSRFRLCISITRRFGGGSSQMGCDVLLLYGRVNYHF